MSDAELERVFPTPVGVFPSQNNCCSVALGLPHARGGVSEFVVGGGGPEMSSPRPWGCFCRFYQKQALL